MKFCARVSALFMALAFTLLGSASANVTRTESAAGTCVLYEGVPVGAAAVSAAQAYWRQVPSWKEVSTDNQLQSFFEAAFDHITKEMGPAAKAGFRDFAKIEGTRQKWNQGLTLGGSGVYYGEGHWYGKMARTVLKGGYIFLAMRCGRSPNDAGNDANFLGDGAEYIFILAERSRQQAAVAQGLSANSTTPTWNEHATQGFDYRWVISAVVDVTPKVLVINELSTFVFKSGVKTQVEALVYALYGGLFGGVYQSVFSQPLAVTRSVNQVFAWRQPSTYFHAGTVLLLRTGAIFASGVVTTYILAPVGKSIVDGINWVTDGGNPLPSALVFTGTLGYLLLKKR